MGGRAPSFVSRSNSPTSLNPLGLLMQIYYFRSDKTLKINVVKLFLVRGFNLCKKSCLLGAVPRCLRRAIDLMKGNVVKLIAALRLPPIECCNPLGSSNTQKNAEKGWVQAVSVFKGAEAKSIWQWRLFSIVSLFPHLTCGIFLMQSWLKIVPTKLLRDVKKI